MSILDDIETAAAFGSGPGGITRSAWSPEMLRLHEWLLARLKAAGLDAHVDGAGNVLGAWASGDGGALLLGSHLDTVPCGGAYDGALGVLGALAAVELLRADGYQPKRPLWIASFNDEEARFGASMVGSRAFVGADLTGLTDLRDGAGTTLAEAMRAAGVDPSGLGDACRVEDVAGYLELHIEQGPVLEQEGAELGVVTDIVGLIRADVTLIGEANHAGTTPMHLRRDAMAGAARIALALREEAGGRADLRATIGALSLSPNASNVIPGRCTFSVDARVSHGSDVGALERLLESTVDRVASEEQLEVHVEILDRDPAVRLSDACVAAIEAAADSEGVRHMRLSSGAGHDAMILASRVPAGMLFVPSRGGVSHSPDEYTEPRHCELGVHVLAHASRLLTECGGDTLRLEGQ